MKVYNPFTETNKPVKTAIAGLLDLSDYPNFSSTGSVKGMKKLYYGKGALLIKQGAYIYNVSSTPDLYFNLDEKQRLEELRKELQTGQLSYGELHELQSLKAHIEPGDVELLQAAGVPEFEDTDTDEEAPDLFETPELIPLNVQAILERYTEDGDELSYTELAAMHAECEAVGYTFEYYLDAVPYGLRKINS